MAEYEDLIVYSNGSDFHEEEGWWVLHMWGDTEYESVGPFPTMEEAEGYAKQFPYGTQV